MEVVEEEPERGPGGEGDSGEQLAAGELHPLYDRVMRWQEAGRPTPRPLTEAELRLLQARGQGAAVQGRPLPAYIAETYRAFCLWYHRAVMAPRG